MTHPELVLRNPKLLITLFFMLTNLFVFVSLASDLPNAFNNNEQSGYPNTTEQKVLREQNFLKNAAGRYQDHNNNNEGRETLRLRNLEGRNGDNDPRWRSDDWRDPNPRRDPEKKSEDIVVTAAVNLDDETGSEQSNSDNEEIIMEEKASVQNEEQDIMVNKEVEIALVEEAVIVEDLAEIEVENTKEEEIKVMIEEAVAVEEKDLESPFDIEIEFISETSMIIIINSFNESQEEDIRPYENLIEENILVVEEATLDVIAVPVTTKCLDSSLYYFPNGSCQADCPNGTYITGTDLSYNQLTCTPCDSTCATCSGRPDHCTSCPSDLPYYFINQTCQKSCPLETYQATKIDEITSLCVPKEVTVSYTNDNETNATTSTTPQQKRVIEVVRGFNSAGGTAASFSMTAVQMLKTGSCSSASAMLLINLIAYIKYLDIQYPPKLIGVFENQMQDIISFDFLPGFPDSDSPTITKYQAPERFARYQVSGLFIVNFWEELFTSILLLFCAILIKFLLRKTLKHPLIKKVLDWAERFLVWNFMITFLLSNLGEAILFSIVEFKSLNLDSGVAVVSFLINLTFFVGYLAFQIFTFIKLHRLRNKQTYANDEQKAEMNPKIKILFEDLKSESFIQEILISLTGLKVTLSSIIIGAIDAPVAQTTLLLLLNLSMIAYLVIYKPLKIRRKNVEVIIYESLMFIGSATCLHFAVQDHASQSTDYSAEDTIIVINLILIFCMLGFQVFDIGIETKKFVSNCLKKRKSQKVHPVNEDVKTSASTKTLESNPTEGNLEVKMNTENELKPKDRFDLRVLTVSTNIRRQSSLNSQMNETSDLVGTALTCLSSNNFIDPSPKSGLNIP